MDSSRSMKIKVFLGAYINQSNAQNLNCKVLAEYLDKDKFKVYTLKIAHGNLGDLFLDNVMTFMCRYPVKLTQYFGFFWGIWNADIAYLPRGNDFKLQRFLVRLLRTKSFKTVENIIDKESLETALSVLGNLNNALDNYRFVNRTYSITQYMKEYNFQKHGLMTQNQILPPAIDTLTFSTIYTKRTVLTGIVFISNDMKRKNVNEFVKLAEHNEYLTFHIIGRKNEYLNNILQSTKAKNILCHGLLNHEKMLEVLQGVQLHVLTSRSEGFPKGIIECAAAGIPSVVYDDYGAQEWIENEVSGVICKEFQDMIKVIFKLQTESDSLSRMSSGAKELAKKFDVEKVTKLYESEIVSLFDE